MRVFGYKEVTMRYLEALELKGGDGGACKVLRIPQVPDRYRYYVDIKEYELGDLNEPPNYKAALADPESDKWLEAMNTKMQSMKDN
ncbi:hypothetical protein Tco_0067588 [Tanacetum coccineum]